MINYASVFIKNPKNFFGIFKSLNFKPHLLRIRPLSPSQIQLASLKYESL